MRILFLLCSAICGSSGLQKFAGMDDIRWNASKEILLKRFKKVESLQKRQRKAMKLKEFLKSGQGHIFSDDEKISQVLGAVSMNMSKKIQYSTAVKIIGDDDTVKAIGLRAALYTFSMYKNDLRIKSVNKKRASALSYNLQNNIEALVFLNKIKFKQDEGIVRFENIYKKPDNLSEKSQLLFQFCMKYILQNIPSS